MDKMVLDISSRAQKIVQSEIRNMSLECDKVNGINLSQGICDLETPEIVKEEAKKAIDEGVNHYTRYDGLPELREAIATKIKRDNRIEIDAEKNIVVSGGATGAFYCAAKALLDVGDEAILFEPYYGYHLETLTDVGIIPKFARLERPNWKIDFCSLEKATGPKTKGIMINTPANPSGKVFSKAELESLLDFAEEHDLFVFTDEIYEYFVYDCKKHISPISIAKDKERILMISGHSKTFSTTGWRIGYVVCDEKWKEAIGYENDKTYVCAPSCLQLGIAKGINDLNKEFYHKLAGEYQKKRDKLCRALKDSGLTPSAPQGAYYVLADARRLAGKTSKEKAMNLLHEAGVAGVPGSAFYHDGDERDGRNLIRFCFAKKDSELEEACERLKRL